MMPTGLHDAQRIVVFRGLLLGDALCAVPAWRALRAACPQAQITWVGLPWAAGLAERLPMIDHFIAFPGAPVADEPPPDAQAWPAFLASVRARRFDWALQLHGNGLASNPVVAQFGAAQMACFVPRRRARFPAEVLVPWPRDVDEIDRLLTLTDALDCPRQGRHLEFPIEADDRAALQALWPDTAPPLAEANAAVVHVDAASPPHRTHRTVQVADALAARGHTVVLTGAAPDAAALAQAMSHPSVNLAGRTSLWTLAALVERARCVASDDPGVSALAAALQVQRFRIDDGPPVHDPGRHLAPQAVWPERSTRPA